MSAEPQPLSNPSISRSELYWLAGAVIFAAIVRLSFPGRMAVEHFDEGVYASNFWFDPEQGSAYPARYLYAPPLLPAAIEWTMILASLCGISPVGFIPLIPCLIAGIAMIPSIWWVARQWFGPTAGLISAWLVATSDFHSCYSRTALTDVPLCLFILWGVYFTWRAFIPTAVTETPPTSRKSPRHNPVASSFRWKEIGLAGLFTGLAWWTKYNGWLPLAIGLTGGTLWQVLTPRAERQIRRMLVSWVSIAAIAFVIWSPVLWGLQSEGGYAKVAANHRGYVVGFRGWFRSAEQQMRNVGFYENPLDLLYSPFIGQHGDVVIIDGAVRFRLRLRSAPVAPMLVELQDIIFVYWTPNLVPYGSLFVSTAICFWMMFRSRDRSIILPLCLVTAWFGGMTVATPFYYPYPRLALPWLCSTWICLGLVFRAFETDATTGPSRSAFVRWHKPIIIAMALVFGLRLITGSAFAWQDRSSVQSTARQFADQIKRETKKQGFAENEAIVYVLGKPAMVFGLKSEGVPLVGPVADFSFTQRSMSRPTFVVASPEPIDPNEDAARMRPRFETVDTVPMTPSHLVANDDPDGLHLVDALILYRQIK